MRRHVLALASAGLAALLAGSGRGAAEPPGDLDTHAVVVILGGGVRAREMLDPERMPTVAAIGARGVVVDRVQAEATSPYQGALRLLSASTDVPDAGTHPRPATPTLLEHVRRARRLPPEAVWFVSAPGGDDLNLAASADADFGPAAAPSVATGDGAFGGALAAWLETYGRPLPTEEATWTLLRSLRARSRAAAEAWLPEEVDAGRPEAERVERALLADLDRLSALAKGPAPDDQHALRAARTVLVVHRPVLLVVRLTGAAVAQASFQRYLEVLAADDRGIAALRAAVDDDPHMRGRTSFWVVSEMGRSASPNARGGLDPDLTTPEGREAAFVAEGAGLKRGGRAKGPRRLADVAPTVARALGVEMPGAAGAPLEGLLTPPGAGPRPR